MKERLFKFLPAINIIFSSLHFIWMWIIAQRVDLFKQGMWIAFSLPLAILVNSLLSFFGQKSYRAVTLSAYLLIVLLSSYIIIMVSVEMETFGFSIIREPLIYVFICIAILGVNFLDALRHKKRF